MDNTLKMKIITLQIVKIHGRALLGTASYLIGLSQLFF